MAVGDNGRDLPRRLPCANLLSPIPVGFLGLIVAIVLWGTAYKLSLYHPHPAPSMRAQVAKLWLETRISYAVPVREIKGIPGDRSHLYALISEDQLCECLIRVPWSPGDLFERQILAAEFPIPSRSPPSFQLCLDYGNSRVAMPLFASSKVAAS